MVETNPPSFAVSLDGPGTSSRFSGSRLDSSPRGQKAVLGPLTASPWALVISQHAVVLHPPVVPLCYQMTCVQAAGRGVKGRGLAATPDRSQELWSRWRSVSPALPNPCLLASDSWKREREDETQTGPHSQTSKHSTRGDGTITAPLKLLHKLLGPACPSARETALSQTPADCPQRSSLRPQEAFIVADHERKGLHDLNYEKRPV